MAQQPNGRQTVNQTPAQGAERAGYHDVDDYLPYLLAHASALVSRQIDDMAALENLSRNETKVLLTLSGDQRRREGLSLNQLAAIMLVKQPTLSRVVDGMVTAGLVERRTVDADRRSVDITLTNAGRRKAAPVLAHAQALDGQFRTQLGSAEAGALIALLNQLIGRLET